MVSILTGYFFSYNSDMWYITFSVQMCATIYSTTWDYTMDWGLLRCWEWEHFGLRKV